MADGEVTIKLDPDVERRLREAANAAGRSVGDYVAGLIAVELDSDTTREALEALADYDRSGVSLDANTEMAAFRIRVAARD